MEVTFWPPLTTLHDNTRQPDTDAHLIMEEQHGQGTAKYAGGLGSDALLEEFLESIEILPNELRRGLLLMRDLDVKIDGAQIQSARLEQDLLDKARLLVAQRYGRNASSGGFGGTSRSSAGNTSSKSNNNKSKSKKSKSKNSKDQELDHALAQLVDGTDNDLKQIMDLFDASIHNADEKIQVSYQLSDHIRQCSNNLDTSIGKVNSANDASKMSRFVVGAMVATQVFDDDSAEPSYILGKVLRFDKNMDQWIIADAEEETKQHRLTPDQITELLEVPFNELPKYKKGDKVMALYPNTTTFYPAEVQVPPRKAIAPHPSYLIVTFDGDFDVDGNVPQLGVACNFVFRSLQQKTVFC